MSTSTATKAVLRLLQYFGGEIPSNLSKPIVANVPPCRTCEGKGYLLQPDTTDEYDTRWIREECPRCSERIISYTISGI